MLFQIFPNQTDEEIKDLLQGRMRSEVSDTGLKVDLSQVLFVMLCYVDMMPLCQHPVYYEQIKTAGCDQYSTLLMM